MKRILLSITSFLVLFYCTIIYAHDDNIIHPAITELSVSRSNIEQYLQNNLNFKNGLKTIFPSAGKYNVLQLLKDGSTAEDDISMCRASNHFLNSTKSWDAAGMSDSPWWINTVCNSWSPYFSAVTWATGFTSPTGTPIPYDPGNYKSPNVWASARSLYNKALTATTQASRESYFAQTFVAIGQVMHLLQDMSVPSHVRNDFQSHLIFNGYCANNTCSGNPIKWFGNPFEYYVKTHAGLVSQAASSPLSNPPQFTNPRLTDLWDTKNSGSSPLGLAQHTNTKYLSDSTIPNNQPSAIHTFPLPAINNTNTFICDDYEPGSTKKRKYFSRSACTPAGAARTVDHFATPSLLNNDTDIIPANITTLKLWLDDNVHKTYAGELLPLAIGYSSAVLDYFFRGKMEVKCLPVIENNKILYVKLDIKNTTPDESMPAGKLMLTGKYTDGSNQEILVKASFWTPDDDNLYDFYTVSNLDSGKTVEAVRFFFTEGNEIPLDKWDEIKLTLIYQGKLGNEEGAIVGKVFSPGKLKFNEEWNELVWQNRTVT
ncbi:MAG: hypothetical protein K4571_07280 [Deltaproteobacteria bacterium]